LLWLRSFRCCLSWTFHERSEMIDIDWTCLEKLFLNLLPSLLKFFEPVEEQAQHLSQRYHFGWGWHCRADEELSVHLHNSRWRQILHSSARDFSRSRIRRCDWAPEARIRAQVEDGFSYTGVMRIPLIFHSLSVIIIRNDPFRWAVVLRKWTEETGLIGMREGKCNRGEKCVVWDWKFQGSQIAKIE
jgi:hypothetical protein